MKHIKHFEELNYRTYLSAAKELRRISPKKNKERYEELQNHADVIELKKRRNELSKISSPISIKITDTENSGRNGVGRFYPLLCPEYATLQDYLADGTVESIPFTLVIVPADDETVEMCLNTMPEGDDLSVCGYGAMWLTIGLTLDEGTYELDRLKVVDMDQYVYGECELQGRAAYGGIKQTLYRMFSDKSSEFYQEFEETVIAGMGLSSDHGLSMDKIANHLKSLSVNTGFIADDNSDTN
jgi:hypothetical protein